MPGGTLLQFPRRQFLHLAAGAAALPAVSRIARAQPYPTRPVRLMVGFAPGQAIDIVARLMAQWLSERLAQQFIIENRPGAGGNIAAEVVARAPADGYALLVVGANYAINATLYEKLNYNLIRDIVPVASIYRVIQVMEVNPAFPATTVPEFITYAKANPGRINFASAGTGSVAHVTGELFKMMSGVNMQHVAYRGAPPALTDLLAGQVQVMFDNLPSSVEHIRAGRLRALAVTATTRWQGLPDIPTVSDFVPVSRPAPGLASVRPRARPPRPSTSSIRRSTPASPIPRSRRGSPIWAAWCFRAHPPTSASSSPTRPTSGARWSSSLTQQD
jgi:tripartite-type tricarboxylate transporter receptor subunit TctC